LTPLPSRLWHTAAVTNSQQAFIFGGEDDTGTIKDTIVAWDPQAQTATTTGDHLLMPTRSLSAAWSGVTGYLFGGDNGTSLLDSITAFHPDAPAGARTDNLTATLPTPRSGTSAVWAGQYAYIFGGVDANGTTLDEIVRFDPFTILQCVSLGQQRSPEACLRWALWGCVFDDLPISDGLYVGRLGMDAERLLACQQLSRRQFLDVQSRGLPRQLR
jgi:hypothetical protein